MDKYVIFKNANNFSKYEFMLKFDSLLISVKCRVKHKKTNK